MNIPRERGVTRRELVAAGGTAALASLVSGGPVAQAIAAARPSHLRRSTYLALTERRFRGRPADLPVLVPRTAFTLVEIADLPRAKALAKYRKSDHAFHLLFDGPLRGTQGIYVLEHPAIGSFRLFLTPVGRPATAQRYEAIVDRLYRPTRKHPAPKRRA